MVPTMLLFGMFCGIFAIGGLAPRTLAIVLVVGSVIWGAAVGMAATSWTVWFGGTALGAANASVGLAVVWAIGWPVRQSRSTAGCPRDGRRGR